MTIYSQHPNRGKVQILATYRARGGVVSATVTSVEDDQQASAIVGALNSISAAATTPVSVWDERDGFTSYPEDHIEAVIDPARRETLIQGEHSLWYELAKLLLYNALNELDVALAAVPVAVRKAVETELQTDVSDLRAEVAEFAEGHESNANRLWEWNQPFVTHADEISDEVRTGLDKLEAGISQKQRASLASNLRLIYEAHRIAANENAMLDLTATAIMAEPTEDEEPDYYLAIDSPSPKGSPRRRRSWDIHIGRWIPDAPDASGSHGEHIVNCVFTEAPNRDDLVALLNLAAAGRAQYVAWAATPVGQPLSGTPFVVTARDDTHA